MITNKQSYPKPLPARFARHTAESSSGWLVIFVVAVGFAGMILLALGSGRA